MPGYVAERMSPCYAGRCSVTGVDVQSDKGRFGSEPSKFEDLDFNGVLGDLENLEGHLSGRMRGTEFNHLAGGCMESHDSLPALA